MEHKHDFVGDEDTCVNDPGCDLTWGEFLAERKRKMAEDSSDVTEVEAPVTDTCAWRVVRNARIMGCEWPPHPDTVDHSFTLDLTNGDVQADAQLALKDMAEIQREGQSARDRQVGGSHYQRKIQPWDVVDEYSLSYYRGNALKYLLRAGTKEGVTAVTDLEKAVHYIERAIEVERGDTPGA